MWEKIVSVIGKIIYDHWLLLLSALGISVITFVKSLRDEILKLMNIDVPIWSVFVLFVALGIVYLLYEKLLHDREESSETVLERPENEIVRYQPEEYAGVKWCAWLGSGEQFADRRIWVDGPFCKTCMYELDKYEKSWFCVTCNKRYQIPSQLRKNLKVKMCKIFTVKSAKSDGLKPVTL